MDRIEKVSLSKEPPKCTRCSGKGFLWVDYPGGGESTLPCDTCRGTGIDVWTPPPPPEALPEKMIQAFQSPLIWTKDPGLAEAASLLPQESPEYRCQEPGILWEIFWVGEALGFYRLRRNGECLGDFETSQWPKTWKVQT